MCHVPHGRVRASCSLGSQHASGTRRQAQGFDSVLSTVGALSGSGMLKQRTKFLKDVTKCPNWVHGNCEYNPNLAIACLGAGG